MIKREIIVTDKRINRGHYIRDYYKLAQEMITTATGMANRKLGGYVCTYDCFVTTSHSRDSQIDIEMDFDKNLAKLTVWDGRP